MSTESLNCAYIHTVTIYHTFITDLSKVAQWACTGKFILQIVACGLVFAGVAGTLINI